MDREAKAALIYNFNILPGLSPKNSFCNAYGLHIRLRRLRKSSKQKKYTNPIKKKKRSPEVPKRRAPCYLVTSLGNEIQPRAPANCPARGHDSVGKRNIIRF